MRATELRGKHLGMFVDRQRVEDERGGPMHLVISDGVDEGTREEIADLERRVRRKQEANEHGDQRAAAGGRL